MQQPIHHEPHMIQSLPQMSPQTEQTIQLQIVSANAITTNADATATYTTTPIAIVV